MIILSAESMYIYASKKHVLQVKDTVTDFLSSSLVPELGSDVSAGTAGNGHLVLIAVSAVRALPDQLAGLILDNLDLSVVATALAVIALRVQLRIHDVIIDELHHRENRRDVVLHIRNLNVADCATRGQLLELGLEFQLAECVDLLSHMNMITVRDVVLVGDSLDDAKTLLQALCKLVRRGLHRRAVYRVADILCLLPRY